MPCFIFQYCKDCKRVCLSETFGSVADKQACLGDGSAVNSQGHPYFTTELIHNILIGIYFIAGLKTTGKYYELN